jgi:hypothetical protein
LRKWREAKGLRTTCGSNLLEPIRVDPTKSDRLRALLLSSRSSRKLTQRAHKVWELRLTEYREAVFTRGNTAARSGHSIVFVGGCQYTKHSPPFTVASSLPPSFRPHPSFFRNGPSSRPRPRQLCPRPPKSPMYRPW